MNKPLLTGFIKDNNDLSWEKFNTLLEKVDFEMKLYIYILLI